MSAMPHAEDPALSLFVREARPVDTGKGLARLDPADMRMLGLRSGDIVAIAAKRVSHARILPAPSEMRGQSLLVIDGALRASIGAALGDAASVRPASAAPAQKIVLFVEDGAASPGLADAIKQQLQDMVVTEGDALTFRLFGGRAVSAVARECRPQGAVIAGPATIVDLVASPRGDGAPQKVERSEKRLSYEDLGGLKPALQRVREVVELPIRRPELFARLGIDAPRGVLLSGPPGTGKTLLARAVAAESDARFFQINGPEIIGKHYGESEEHLRAIFEQAGKKTPSIIFIDEIDAIAPKRDSLTGDKQVERRIVAQLLTLMDGLSDRGAVIVLAATNLPDSLDPALRRPGRFDREIAIAPPDRFGRREILDIHTRGMPLSPEIDLDRIAAETHGYVGADLAALTREAGMAALRRLSAFDRGAADTTRIDVLAEDFETALAEVRPSAMREAFTETPETGWDDVAGAETLREALTEAVIWPIQACGPVSAPRA